MRLALVCALGWAALACGPSRQAPPTPATPGTPYRATGPVWERGPLAVLQRDLVEGEFGAPRPARLHAPVPGAELATYPVVVFQHGFLADVGGYDEILAHLASHGFVVVAPQMYPADGVFLGKPTARAEAALAREVAHWAHAYAATVTGHAADPRPPGVAGHSRGGKVSWLLLLEEGLEARALVGVDPVDGRGGPLFGAQPEALPGPVSPGAPALVVGMALGGACAPAADGYRHFFERTASPVTLFEVLGHGHADMLDPDVAEANTLCARGTDLAGVRALTGGLLAAFFRRHLQDDLLVDGVLAGAELPPLEVVHERR